VQSGGISVPWMCGGFGWCILGPLEVWWVRGLVLGPLVACGFGGVCLVPWGRVLGTLEVWWVWGASMVPRCGGVWGMSLFQWVRGRLVGRVQAWQVRGRGLGPLQAWGVQGRVIGFLRAWRVRGACNRSRGGMAGLGRVWGRLLGFLEAWQVRGRVLGCWRCGGSGGMSLVRWRRGGSGVCPWSLGGGRVWGACPVP